MLSGEIALRSSHYYYYYDQGVVCLFCHNTFAVIKEYNVIRHYASKNFSQFDEIHGLPPMDKIEHLEKHINEQQGVFHHLKERFRTGYKTEFSVYVS